MIPKNQPVACVIFFDPILKKNQFLRWRHDLSFHMELDYPQLPKKPQITRFNFDEDQKERAEIQKSYHLQKYIEMPRSL